MNILILDSITTNITSYELNEHFDSITANITSYELNEHINS